MQETIQKFKKLVLADFDLVLSVFERSNHEIRNQRIEKP
jgi:hypothetical protein